MTKGLSATEERRQRIQNILLMLQQAKDTAAIIDDNKFLFEIQLRYGLTKSKAQEYLEVAKHGII